MKQNNVKIRNFAEAYPELVAQWHPTKNGDVTVDGIDVKSKKKYWWTMSYDDPETGKHYEFEWQDTVANRVRGAGCPFLAKRAVWPGFNDLATKYPELAAQLVQPCLFFGGQFHDVPPFVIFWTTIIGGIVRSK